MKKGIALLGLLILVSVAILYFFVFTKKKGNENTAAGEQPQDLPVISRHSEAFNKSVENFMNAYYSMIEGFVNWDTAIVRKESTSFKTALDSFKIDELKADSIGYTEVEKSWNAVKSETAAIVGDNRIDEQRGSLNILSQALFGLLNKIHYDHAKVYFQECPMAFYDENPGNWLSALPAIRNPYLGVSHPKYHSGMLKCGTTKDSVNFISPRSN